MKKVFAAVFAIVLILFGLSIRSDINRLDPVKVTEEGGCVRVDTSLCADEVFDRLGGRVLWKEVFDGVTVYYGYSDFVRGYAVVHSFRVNVMVAEREEYTAVGMPLLTGSY